MEGRGNKGRVGLAPKSWAPPSLNSWLRPCVCVLCVLVCIFVVVMSSLCFLYIWVLWSISVVIYLCLCHNLVCSSPVFLSQTFHIAFSLWLSALCTVSPYDCLSMCVCLSKDASSLSVSFPLSHSISLSFFRLPTCFSFVCYSSGCHFSCSLFLCLCLFLAFVAGPLRVLFGICQQHLLIK